MTAGMGLSDTIGMLVAFIFTVLVLLYAFDDNVLFRLAVYVFIGVSAGYAGAVAIKDVLMPRLMNLGYTEMLLVIGWVALLALKLSPKTARLGNPAVGLLVGVGAAIAIGGAIQGTLIPQITSASDYFVPSLMQEARQAGDFSTVLWLIFQGSVILVGTMATVAHFHFSAQYVPNQIPKRARWIETISKIGQVFIATAFGVIFAGVYSAALTALIERLAFLVDFIKTLLSSL